MALSIKDGYVVYTRGENSKQEYWRRKHYQAISGVNGISDFYSDETQSKYVIAGNSLISLAMSERNKEIDLIRSAGFDVNNVDDIKIFIERFNEILMGKQQFDNARTRLKFALNEKNQSKEYRAPTIASWFTSYLGTALNKNINSFIGKNKGALISQDFSSWASELDNIVNKSIRQAFKKMLTEVTSAKNKELYGDSEQWKQVYEISQQIEHFNDYFVEMIRSKIDFSRIKNIFQNEAVNIQKKSHRGIRKVIDSPEGLNLKSESKSRSIGGSVEEYLMNILNSIGAGASKASSSGSRVFTSEKIKTDNVTLFNYEATIDSTQMSQNLVDLLNQELYNATSINNAAQIMDSFYEKYLSQLDNSFIVYGSTKSYSMSDSFKGFSAGTSRKLSEAQAVLAEAGVSNSSSVEDYINVAYNTGSGAYFSGRRAEVEENLKVALMSAAAHLLFDDWVSIGESPKGGAKAIHVLQLEGINLPLSVFLEASGRAMIEATSDIEAMVKVNIKLPGTINYQNPMKVGHKSEVLAAWEAQANQAKNESTFSMHFLMNFKSIVSQWINF